MRAVQSNVLDASNHGLKRSESIPRLIRPITLVPLSRARAKEAESKNEAGQTRFRPVQWQAMSMMSKSIPVRCYCYSICFSGV